MTTPVGGQGAFTPKTVPLNLPDRLNDASASDTSTVWYTPGEIPSPMASPQIIPPSTALPSPEGLL